MDNKIQDKTLEELEKTTDLLKNFEPRVSKETSTADLDSIFNVSSSKPIVPDYREEPMVVPVYEDVDKLESVPIPSVQDAKQEKVEEMVEEVFSTPKEENNSILLTEKELEPLDIQYTKEMKQKRLAKRLMVISLLFIPGLLSALIVAHHSNLLINSTLQGIVIIMLGLAVGTLAIGITIYLRNRNSTTISPNNIWKKGAYSIFMGCYAGGCIALLLLLYGPSTSFKDWLVTTAMATMSHQHYCKWFYDDSDIEEVFSRNYIEETGDSTNPDLIDFDALEQPNDGTPIVYENEYERIVLERNPEDIYKMVTFNVNGCKAYLAIIYDPSKVHVTTTNRIGVSGQYVTDMAKRENALVAINGAGFYDPGHNSSGGKPRGITIVNGKIVTNNEYKAVTTGGLIGFTQDNKLVLLKNTTAKKALEMGVRDAVSWGPFLIVNGVSAYTKGNGGWGYAARTAIGQRADGIVLFLVVDSNANRTKGANMVDLTRIMENYGAINATNLDGGTSSVMVENGELINNPIDSTLSRQTRPIATSFIVTE